VAQRSQSFIVLAQCSGGVELVTQLVGRSFARSLVALLVSITFQLRVCCDRSPSALSSLLAASYAETPTEKDDYRMKCDQRPLARASAADKPGAPVRYVSDVLTKPVSSVNNCAIPPPPALAPAKTSYRRCRCVLEIAFTVLRSRSLEEITAG